MDVLKRARELYAAGRMHDALEAAQAACDRAPKDPEAWWLLGCVSRHTGLLAASDVAFQKASELDRQIRVPYRVSPARFAALVDEVCNGLSAQGRLRLGYTAVRVQAIPAADQVRQGLDPDSLSRRDNGQEQDVLILYQVNHENRSANEEALRALVSRSLEAPRSRRESPTR